MRKDRWEGPDGLNREENILNDKADQMTESEFRGLARKIFQQVEDGLEDVDPDQVECEESLGSLIIQIANGAKWILSVQPPVRQIWLAVASLGRAYHFDYDSNEEVWMDDKGEGLELMGLLSGILKDVTGIVVVF